MYIGGMDYACRTECFWWVIMGLGPCRVGLCSNVSSFIPIIYKNWSFLPHLILETKIAHHTGMGQPMGQLVMPPLFSNVVSSPGHTLTSIPAPNSLQHPPHAPLSQISDHPGHNLDAKTVKCIGEVKNSQTSHQYQSVLPLEAPESSARSA